MTSLPSQRAMPRCLNFSRGSGSPGLGLTLLSDRYVQRLGIQGVVIYEVPVDSEAYRQGLRGLTRSRMGRLVIQDVIKEIDGKKIRSYDDLYNLLDDYKIGDRVTLTVERDGKTRKVDLTLVRVD